ncbi:MAG: tRNA preQ1(34) S-adenosylmethionine ribosyltransferase-isomerase QueA [Candidatus Obscuribacterales bacterium]|nr:tRNA preQ1(34) S-adenosylmethionine ribosyltransferase-isomerase QueA [Candidatus Obscuribacterales bacterium]
MTKSTFNQPTQDQSFSLEDLSYDLPEELIAQEPSENREESRLLVLDRGSRSTSHHRFADIKSFLGKGDVLVVNDTRVVPSRIYANRASGGSIRLLLIRPQGDKVNLWEALVTPIKRLKIGETLEILNRKGSRQTIKIADIIIDPDGFKRLVVDLGKPEHVFDILSSIGYAPLPPYIVRDSESRDEESRLHDLDRYQTVFARHPGAVAAPTAGLHFSEELLRDLSESGVIIKSVTLHVGPGTFKPIGTDIDTHSIEAETFQVTPDTAEAINLAKDEGRRVIAVGTTSLRTLETAGATGRIVPCEHGSTSLYVKPGFQFKIVDAMITNFHLSRSSLLVLVATFAGKDSILSAYEEAIAQRYRFFSYGDAMFIS